MGAIDDARGLIEARLKDLDDERKKLENALRELGGGVRRRARSRVSKPSAGKPKARRKRKGGTRADHALSYIAKHPAATASEIAKKLKIKPNYLYRVLGDLEKEGKVKKAGRTYTAT
jgi:ribosomal protein S25